MTSAFVEPPDTSEITIRRSGETIVVRPAPRREPPFDDELEDAPPSVSRYDRPLPFERVRRHLTLQPTAPPPLRGALLPDPGQWGRRLLVGVIETAAGRRPLNQLTTLLSASVAHGLRNDFEQAARGGRPHWTHAAIVRSMRSSQPADDVAELSATVRCGTRVRAIAMRLEVRHGRWCCTRLMLG
jgi:hypothetical protein